MPLIWVRSSDGSATAVAAIERYKRDEAGPRTRVPSRPVALLPPSRCSSDKPNTGVGAGQCGGHDQPRYGRAVRPRAQPRQRAVFSSPAEPRKRRTIRHGPSLLVKRGGRYWTRTSDFLGVSEAL